MSKNLYKNHAGQYQIIFLDRELEFLWFQIFYAKGVYSDLLHDLRRKGLVAEVRRGLGDSAYYIHNFHDLP